MRTGIWKTISGSGWIIMATPGPIAAGLPMRYGNTAGWEAIIRLLLTIWIKSAQITRCGSRKRSGPRGFSGPMTTGTPWNFPLAVRDLDPPLTPTCTAMPAQFPCLPIWTERRNWRKNTGTRRKKSKKSSKSIFGIRTFLKWFQKEISERCRKKVSRKWKKNAM